jgi:hypothetical protein
MRNATFLLVCLFSLAAFGIYTQVNAEDATPAATSAPLGQAGVLKSVDVITLTDGTTLKGKIIAEGAKAVVIIVEVKGKVEEKSVERAKISKIEKGKQEPVEEYYETGVVDGEEKVTKKKDGSTAPSTSTASPAPAVSGPTRPGTSATRTPTATAKPSGTASTSGALTTKSPEEDLHTAFEKDKGYAGLVKIIGKDNAIELIKKSRNLSHFTRMVESINKDGSLRTRDLIDFFNRGNVKLDDETRKKASRYLTDLAFNPSK